MANLEDQVNSSNDSQSISALIEGLQSLIALKKEAYARSNAGASLEEISFLMLQAKVTASKILPEAKELMGLMIEAGLLNFVGMDRNYFEPVAMALRGANFLIVLAEDLDPYDCDCPVCTAKKNEKRSEEN